MLGIERDDSGNLRLRGRFDAAAVEEAERVLGATDGPLALDLEELEYIASAGISVLLRVHKHLLEHGHALRLCHPRPHVLNVLRYAGLDQVFTIE